MLTVVVATVLIVSVAYAVQSRQSQSSRREQELQAQRANIPARQAVYPLPVPLSPTLVLTSQTTPDISGLDAPFRVLTRATQLRSGPGTQYAIVRSLAAGEQVRVLFAPIEIGGQQWQQVRTADGQIGWCRVSELLPGNAGE